MDVRHGKMTIGKLTATDNANPIFVISTPKESGNAVSIFPKTNNSENNSMVSRTPLKYNWNNNCNIVVIITSKIHRIKGNVAKESNTNIDTTA